MGHSTALPLLLAALLLRHSISTNYGEGYFDTVLSIQRDLALGVEIDEDTDSYVDYPGGFIAKGAEYYEMGVIDPGVTRNDTLEAGYFMMYNLSLTCHDWEEGGACNKTELEDKFIVFTFDLGHHPALDVPITHEDVPGAPQAQATASLFFLQDLPHSDQSLDAMGRKFRLRKREKMGMEERCANESAYDNGNGFPRGWADKAQDCLKFEQNGADLVFNNISSIKGTAGAWNENENETMLTLTWGFDNTDQNNTLVPGRNMNISCMGNVMQYIYIGVHCVEGSQDFHILDQDGPTPRSRCPYMLGINVVKRYLQDGDTVTTLVGSGHWQAFQFQIGVFDYINITITRNEYDNETYSNPFFDGFQGSVWLSRASCVAGTIYTLDFMSGDLQNVTYFVDPDEYIYNVTIGVGGGAYDNQFLSWDKEGTLDDRGYSGNLTLMKEYQHQLDLSMDYSEQKRLRKLIDDLTILLEELSNQRAWLRHWSMQRCSVKSDEDFYYLTVHGSHTMSRVHHNGYLTLSLSHYEFKDGIIQSGQVEMGCLTPGRWRYYTIYSKGPHDATIGLFEVVPALMMDKPDNHISGLYVAVNSTPTLEEHMAFTVYPNTQLSLSPTNVWSPRKWVFGVFLDESDTNLPYVIYKVNCTLENTILMVGDSITTTICCNQFKYYVIEEIGADSALSVFINISLGRMKAVFWKWEDVPIPANDVVGDRCMGWCQLEWMEVFSNNLGEPQYRTESRVAVPYGLGQQTDKRRGGRWYLGLQPDPIETCEITLEISLFTPQPPAEWSCDRYEHFCPTKYLIETQSRQKGDSWWSAPSLAGCYQAPKWGLALWLWIAALAMRGSGF